MLNKIGLTLLVFIFVLLAHGQPPSIQWQKCLGGTLDEIGRSIHLTIDGGYLVGGYTVSNDGDVSGNYLVGHADYWVVKLDSIGALQWQKCYGGSAEEFLYSIQSTEDGGFIAVGAAGSNDGDVLGAHPNGGDTWVIRCDSIGQILWQNCLGGSQEDGARKVIKYGDGGFLVFGYTQSDDFDVIDRHVAPPCTTCADAWLVKLDSTGVIQWSKCYGGFYAELGYSIIPTLDSGFAFAAFARSDNGDVQGVHMPFNGQAAEDFWIVKIDSIGNILWQKCFGGSEVEIPYDIYQTSDSGYIAIGKATSNDYDVIGHHGGFTSNDAWIVKLNGFGDLQWQKCLGGFDDDFGYKIIQLANKGYLVLCSSNSTDGDLANNPANGGDVWLLNLDSAGNILWQKCFGGSFGDAGFDIQPTPDGGYIFIGGTESNDGDVSGSHGNTDVWVVKLEPLPNTYNECYNPITDFSCHLNPTQGKLSINFFDESPEHIAVQLIDITGRILNQQHLISTPGFNKIEINTGSLSNGIYLVWLETKNRSMVKKVIAE